VACTLHASISLICMYFELFVEGRIGLDHVAFHWKSEIDGSDHTVL